MARTIEQATQTPANVGEQIPFAAATPSPAPPSLSTGAPRFNALSLGPPTSIFGTDADWRAQFYRAGIPVERIPPLPTQASISKGSQIESIASQSILGAFAANAGSLSMPNIFGVGGDLPITKTGQPISVFLVAQPPNTFFAGPSANTTLDHFLTGVQNAYVNQISLGPLTPSSGTEFNIVAVTSVTSVSVQPAYTPARGWQTAQSDGQGATFIQNSGSAITASIGLGNPAIYAAVFAQFFSQSNTGVPTLVQQNSNTGPIPIGNGTISLPGAAGAGSSLFAIFHEINTGTVPTYSIISDTQGNKWNLVATASAADVGLGNHTCTVYMFYTSNIIGGVDTVTFNKAGGVGTQGAAWIGEVSNLTTASVPPSFRKFTVSDFNSGINASNTTFWRGDLTWAAIPIPQVNGSPIPGTDINLNSTTPAAPSGDVPVFWQADSTTPVTNVSAYIKPFVASGSSHTPGAVPDPGATAGTLRFLREDATFAQPVELQTNGSDNADQTKLNIVAGSGLTAVNVGANVTLTVTSGSANTSVSINGIGYSDDYIFTINAEPQVLVNGS